MADHQPWRAFGKCASLTSTESDDLFFITKGKSANPAKRFCSTCVVQKQCLFFAIYYDEDGIWAGTTKKERQYLAALVQETVNESIEAFGFIETRRFTDWLPNGGQYFPQSDESLWGDDQRLVSNL